MIAETLANTVAPHVRLKGADRSYPTGTKHDKLLKAKAVEPSQLVNSGLNVTPSLYRKRIW